MVNIEIKPLWHRGKNNIGLYFSYNDKLAQQLRSIECEFSFSNRCWYIENTESNKRKLLFILKEYNYLVTDADRDSLKLETNLRADLGDYYLRECKELEKYLQLARYGMRTIEVYLNMAELFFGYFKDTTLDRITHVDIERFNYEVIIRRGYSSSYQRQMIGVIKLIYRQRPDVQIDWDLVTKAKVSRRLPEVLSQQEIILIISAIENIKHRAIISLLYAAGLRISELINLRIGDIDSGRMQIRIEQAKGRRDRYVALSDNILILLRNYFEEYRPEHYLFNGPDGGSYSVESIRKILRHACNRAGIRKHVSPHTLRHSYATHLLENGVDLRYVQELLGHRKPETTMIYTHVTKKKLLSIRSPFDLLFTKEPPPSPDINNPYFSTPNLLKGTDNSVKEPELTYF